MPDSGTNCQGLATDAYPRQPFGPTFQPGMDAPEFTVERRIRAAMVLAGIDFDELARRVDQSGMASRTLRGMATPEDPQVPQPHHLRYIAAACGLSPAFFTVDFSSLGDLPVEEPEWAESLRQRMDRLEDEWSSAQLDALGAALAALQRYGGETP